MPKRREGARRGSNLRRPPKSELSASAGSIRRSAGGGTRHWFADSRLTRQHRPRDRRGIRTRLRRLRIAAHLVATDPFFDTRRDKLIALATRHAVPTMYQFREYAVVQLRACTDPRARDKR